MTSLAIADRTINVPFYGNSLFVVDHNGEAYTPMKPIVEGMGLDWKSQHKKLSQRFAKGMVEITIPSAGGMQNMICLALRKLAAWLNSISPNKVRSEIRDRVIQYQEECDDVLYEYWTKGQSVNPRKTSTDERTPLRDAVNLLVGKKNIMYPEAYSYVHQRFNVARIEDLDASQIPVAIEYIHKLALEGELMPKEETPSYDFDFRMHSVNSNALCVLLNQSREIFRKDLEPALRLIDSPVAGKICGRLTDACAIAHSLNKALERNANKEGVLLQ